MPVCSVAPVFFLVATLFSLFHGGREDDTFPHRPVPKQDEEEHASRTSKGLTRLIVRAASVSFAKDVSFLLNFEWGLFGDSVLQFGRELDVRLRAGLLCRARLFLGCNVVLVVSWWPRG